MKKAGFFALVALTAISFSCTDKNEGGPEEEQKTYNTPESESCFYAAFANPAQVLSWNAGDAVAVWENGGNRTAYTVRTDGAETLLEGDRTTKGSTYLALFPDTPEAELAGAEISFSIPQEQTPVAGAFSYNPSVALTTGEHRDFRFYGVCGLLGFTISRTDVTSVLFTGNSHETVAGSVKVDVSEPADQKWTVEEGLDYVVLNPSEGTFTPGTYYFSVLPQFFEKGFTISMNLSDGTQAERVCAIPFTIPQSKCLDAGNIDNLDSWGGNYGISNMQEFLFFVENAAKYDENAAVTLDCDIDLEGVSIPEISKFGGIFDGGGHTISNWVTDHPLFGEFSGTLTSLNIDSSCSYAIPADEDAAFFVRSNSGTLNACTSSGTMACADDAEFSTLRRIGAIAARSTGKVTACENHGNITLSPASVAKTTASAAGAAQVIGGIVGEMSSAAGTAEVSSCINTGSIIYAADAPIQSWTMMGGILGGTAFSTGRSSASVAFSEWQHGNNGTVKNCSNSGDLTYHYNKASTSANNVLNLGGITGYIEGSVEGCTNTGAVTADTWQNFGETTESYVRPISVGGIAGRITKNLTNCTNVGKVFFKGNISNSSASDAYPTGQIPYSAVGGVAAMAGDSQSTTSGCFNKGEIEISAGMTITAGAIFYVGGVSGYSVSTLSGCGNEGDIKVKTSAYTLNAGGIVGFGPEKNISGSDNSGNIDIDLVDQGNTSRECYYMRIGGIIGQRDYVVVSSCDNSGDITLRGGDALISGSSAAGNYIVGGICGYGSKAGSYQVKGTVSDYMCNSGSIVVESQTSVRAGGIEGQCAGSNNVQYARNTGNVTVSSDYTNCYVGGVRGQSGAQINYCINEGNVTFTGGGATCYVAGLSCTMGATKVNGSSNTGNVTYNRTTTSASPAYAALGIAYAKCGSTNINFIDNVLDGTLTVNKASESTGIFMGLVAGYAEVMTLGADGEPLIIRPTASVNGVAATEENILEKSFLAGTVNQSLTITNVKLSKQ